MHLIQQQLALLYNQLKGIAAGLQRYTEEREILLLDDETLRKELTQYAAARKSAGLVPVVSLNEYRQIRSLINRANSKLELNSRKIAAIEELVAKEKQEELKCKDQIRYLESVSNKTAKIYQFPGLRRDD